MTAAASGRVKCPARKGVTHAPTFLSGHCEHGPDHDACHGSITNGCGCVILCRCTRPDHYHPHAHEEPTVPLPSPFSVPDPKAAEHPEALVTPPVAVPVLGVQDLATAVKDWSDRLTPRDRPWIDGTGEPGTLEVMVRCFALAAGDLHLSDDGPDDYDEEALVRVLGVLRAAVRRAGLLDALLVKHMWDHHPHGKHHLPDLGEVNVYRRDAKVTWDTYGTAEAVVDAKMAEREGTLPDDPMEPVRWVLEAAALGYYRKTDLRAMGLDPQDFYTSEKGSLAVDVPVPD